MTPILSYWYFHHHPCYNITLPYLYGSHIHSLSLSTRVVPNQETFSNDWRMFVVTFRYVCVCVWQDSSTGMRVILASSRKIPRMLLNIIQCTGSVPKQKLIWPKASVTLNWDLALGYKCLEGRDYGLFIFHLKCLEYSNLSVVLLLLFSP